MLQTTGTRIYEGKHKILPGSWFIHATLLRSHRKCYWLAVTPAQYFKALFPKVFFFFFLIYKRSNSFCRTFQIGKWPTTILIKASAKGIAKHQVEEYLGKMETKRKIIHPSIWLFKTIYSYILFMVVSIKFFSIEQAEDWISLWMHHKRKRRSSEWQWNLADRLRIWVW